MQRSMTDVADNVFLLPVERASWLDDRCHELKHTPGAAVAILEEMKRFEHNITAGNQFPGNQVTQVKTKLLQNSLLPGLRRPQIKKSLRESTRETQKTLAAAITYLQTILKMSHELRRKCCLKSSNWLRRHWGRFANDSETTP